MRGLIPKSTEGFCALADQGVVCLGMFASNILLASQFTDYEYGVYGMWLGVLLFLNMVHSALVSYLLALEAAGTSRGSIRRSTGAALYSSLLPTVPFAAALLIAGALLGRPWSAAWGFAALLFWQGQETLRRSLLAELRLREAILGDAISYLGQAALLWTLVAPEARSADGLPRALLSGVTGACAGLVGMQLARAGCSVFFVRRRGLGGPAVAVA